MYALMENGQLAYVKIGRSRRVPKRALLELLAGNLRGGWKNA
jgi:excisionase family DNA binding protein